MNQKLSDAVHQRLRDAAHAGNINELYALIEEDAYILERINEIPFVDTPLHIAASAGQIQFALEIMMLKPSFARKLNPDGFSPMHLALQKGQTEMAIELLKADENLLRVKGREGVTPLHYVAAEGNLDLLVEFLLACPDCIRDVTVRGETALHIAAKNNRVEALKILRTWLRRSGHKEVKVLNKPFLVRLGFVGLSCAISMAVIPPKGFTSVAYYVGCSLCMIYVISFFVHLKWKPV